MRLSKDDDLDQYDVYLDGIKISNVIEADDRVNKVWTQGPNDRTYTVYSGIVEFKKKEILTPLYRTLLNEDQQLNIHIQCDAADIGAMVSHLLNDLKTLGLI